jgi:hypothetical protein
MLLIDACILHETKRPLGEFEALSITFAKAVPVAKSHLILPS